MSRHVFIAQDKTPIDINTSGAVVFTTQDQFDDLHSRGLTLPGTRYVITDGEAIFPTSIGALPNTVPLRTVTGAIRADTPTVPGEVVTLGSDFDFRGAFPSSQVITMTVPPSGGTVTAPGDGWMTFGGASASEGQGIFLQIGGLAQSAAAHHAGGGAHASIAVRKDANVKVEYGNYSTKYLNFIPSIGAT